jgi:hypothetical protein
MNFSVNTNNNKCCIELVVFSQMPQQIRIVVYDPKKKDTIYIDRYKTVNDKETFYLRLPQSPKTAVISVFSKGRGNNEHDRTFTYKWKYHDLKTKDLLLKPSTRNFVRFAQEFSENAGVLSHYDSVYMSNDGKYRIDYVDNCRDRKTKTVIPTVARIGDKSKIIEVAHSRFKDKTVPQRMAIMMHEFGHGYLNVNPDDESEADINALRILLSMGYPKLELFAVFCKVFHNANSDQNQDRFLKIKNYITNFQQATYNNE